MTPLNSPAKPEPTPVPFRLPPSLALPLSILFNHGLLQIRQIDLALYMLKIFCPSCFWMTSVLNLFPPVDESAGVME